MRPQRWGKGNVNEPHQETDRLSPHYDHLIQPLDEGQHCLDCDGPLCQKCQREPVHDEEELCGECISEEAQYYIDMRDAEPSALSDTMMLWFEKEEGGQG